MTLGDHGSGTTCPEESSEGRHPPLAESGGVPVAERPGTCEECVQLRQEPALDVFRPAFPDDEHGPAGGF